jgi:hypothetical protein
MKFSISHTFRTPLALLGATMRKRPAYFDSIAAAAAALGTDIEELREAKREGCPAFRSGRVYRDELLTWLEARALEETRSEKLNGIGLEKGRSVIAQTIRGLSACANFGVLTPEQSFDFCLTIVEAAGDPKLREVFRQTILNWLQRNFSEVAEAKAAKAHPKIMSWFRAETKAQSRLKDDDLESLIRSLDEQAKLPALFGQ